MSSLELLSQMSNVTATDSEEARGIIAFLKTTKIDLESGKGETVTEMQMLQNNLINLKRSYGVFQDHLENLINQNYREVCKSTKKYVQLVIL